MEQQPSNDPTAGGGDWRAAAQAAIAFLQDKGVPANVASALRSLAGALAAPGEIPDEAWPALTEKAQVHGTVFEPGTSTKAVVEEAVRYYLFEQQPPRVASRAKVLDRFGAQVGALVNSKAEAND
ncbi:hypothetical protein LJR290_007904 [Variovorax sp. LjRoot290]|uniref:hypothetical protein n=1 Tax=Variovorax sp. LjRoot290 TaxID=3342316 RepID=UPI003ED009A0